MAVLVPRAQLVPLGFAWRSRRSRSRIAFTSSVLHRSREISARVSMAASGQARRSLIEPDGGELVDLVVPEGKRAAMRAEAASMPAVRLRPVDTEWVHVVSEGWASPLRGFMREDEYLQSLHFNSLRLAADGSVVNMSLPIVLAIGDADKEAIGCAADVALEAPAGGIVAILRRIEIYKHNKEERIARTWGQ